MKRTNVLSVGKILVMACAILTVCAFSGCEYPTQAPMPTFSPAGGTYETDQTVTIACSITWALIRYTTDGSTPTASSTEYTAPISVAGNGTAITIKAIAVSAGMITSDVAEAIFTIASSGSLDTGFNSAGSGADSIVQSIALQSDGKILVGGFLTSYNDTPQGYVARLNADGSLDTGFNSGGVGANNIVYSTAVQSDGKILIGGSFSTYDTTGSQYIARLNTDGSLDTGFTAALTGTVNTIVTQSSGKILIGGQFARCLAKLNADGSLDADFNTTGAGANDSISSIAMQSDGKILIGGGFSTYNGTVKWYLARLNADGSLDTTFNTAGTGPNGTIYSVVVQGDGRIIAAGSFDKYNGTDRGCIARLNTDGSLDTGFLAVGKGAAGSFFYIFTTLNTALGAIAVQSDGMILIGGIFTTFNGANQRFVTRLLP